MALKLGIDSINDDWLPLSGATEDFNVRLLLINQHVFVERFKFHVGPEFFPAINPLSRRRQQFDDYLGLGRKVIVTRRSGGTFYDDVRLIEHINSKAVHR